MRGTLKYVRIKQRMAELEIWTQKDLAARAQMTPPRLCQVLGGKRPPNTHEIRRLAKVLGLAEGEIYEPVPPRPPKPPPVPPPVRPKEDPYYRGFTRVFGELQLRREPCQQEK